MTPPTLRRWMPTFSLRVLLIAFTAVALGIPVWYRWPYEDEEEYLHEGRLARRVVTTWRRDWGGGRSKHGLETTYRFDGTKQLVTHYYHGQRQGRFEQWDSTRLATVGYYHHDLKTGIWTTNSYGVKVIEHWRENQLDGMCEFQLPDQPRETITFSKGRLTHVNGRPWSSPLFDAHHRREALSDTRAIDDFVYGSLHGEAWVEFENVPLSSAVPRLETEMFGTFPNAAGRPQILLDPRLPDPHVLLTHSLTGIEDRAALVLLLARVGLVADYHYGSVWITTPELAGPWPDPTGVDEIKPPTGSQLAESWNRPVTVITQVDSPPYLPEKPLADALQMVFVPPGIDLDLSQIEAADDAPNRFPVAADLFNFPFRHALAYLLFQAKCRCKLEGETLVILPPADEW